MASKAMSAGIIGLLALVVAAQSLSFDQEATNNAIAVAGSPLAGEVAILLRRPFGKNARKEELLHIKGKEDVALSVFFNRKSNKVTLESLHQDQLKSVSWSLGDLTHDRMVLVLTHNRVKLSAGCMSMRWHPMPLKHDLLLLLSSEEMKLYHEDTSEVQVFSTEQAALSALNCNQKEPANIKHPSVLTVDDASDVEEVKDFIDKEKRRKREEEMQGDDYRANELDINGILLQPKEQRGDIPYNAIESCDDEVIRQLQLLRETIEHLRREVGDQKGTIDNLRGQLRQCCHRIPAQPQVERCTSSSCYQG